VSRAYGLLSDVQRRKRYDELGASEDDADDDEALDDLGPWRSIKVPFTAFRDRGFYQRAEHISVVYLLLAGESTGPFALEIGEVKAGRCEKAHLDGAGQWGHVSCEQVRTSDGLLDHLLDHCLDDL
jgi:curved DNA-binding protein CbpA